MRRLLLITIALATTACVTTNVSISDSGTTTITTNPPGARVFVNGAEICSATPCNWSEGDGLSHRFHLQLRKEGYRDLDLYLDKELRIFSGFFSPVGYKMPRQVSFTLEGTGAPPPNVPPVPPPPGQPVQPPPAQPGL